MKFLVVLSILVMSMLVIAAGAPTADQFDPQEFDQDVEFGSPRSSSRKQEPAALTTIRIVANMLGCKDEQTVQMFHSIYSYFRGSSSGGSATSKAAPAAQARRRKPQSMGQDQSPPPAKPFSIIDWAMSGRR